MKKGDLVTIHAYKHDGTLYRAWENSKVLEVNDKYVVLENNKIRVTEVDGRRWKTKEPALVFFFVNSWYNIIVQYKERGIFYYCNIACPFIVEENTIKYIDYDLDLRVYPDGNYNVLDQTEYDYNKLEMEYPKEMDLITKDAMNELINMCINKIGPFDKKYLEKYNVN